MTPTTEEWRPVVGYEGLYEVSDQGRVRSVERTLFDGRRDKGRVLRGTPNCRSGRISVLLYRDGTRRKANVHVLVLESFSGPRPPGMVARHLDGNHQHNAAINLQWGTRSENAYDSLAHGTHAQAVKTHCSRGHELVAPNLRRNQLAQGVRGCLACHRGRSAVYNAQRRGMEADLRMLADAFYSRIMSAA